MSSVGSIKVTDGFVTMPKDATTYKVTYTNSTFAQTSVPVIKVATNSKFDLRYLPTISVTEYRPTLEVTEGFLAFTSSTIPGFECDLMYLIPWQNADVYFTRNAEDPTRWNPLQGSYGETKLSLGEITTERSRQNGRYTLVTKMDFGGNVITVCCSIDVI